MNKPIHVTDAEFENVVVKSGKPVLVDFWAAWCAPCRMLAPSIDRVAEEYGDGILVAKIDVDNNPENAARFRIRGIPTLLFFNGGKVVYEQTGAIPYGTLKKLVQHHFGVNPAEAA